MIETVAPVLKDMGLPGAIIIVLMGVIGILSMVIVYQYKQANKVYSYRLAERDTLNKALTDSTAAQLTQAHATEDRNKTTEQLSAVIQKQAMMFEALLERLKNYHDSLIEKQTRADIVLASLADSQRTLAAIASDIQRNMPLSVTELKQHATHLRDETVRVLHDLQAAIQLLRK